MPAEKNLAIDILLAEQSPAYRPNHGTAQACPLASVHALVQTVQMNFEKTLLPKISVHVITYNSAQTIEPCLQSLLEQREADFETVIVDNGSTDDTVRRVEAMRIPVNVNKKNCGYSKAHNQALSLTNSDYVLTLNPDVWLAPDYLHYMMQALDAQPQVGSASGCLLRVEQLGQAPFAIDSTGLFMRRNRRQGLRNEGGPVETRPTQSHAIFGPDGAAAFYRRTMLDDIRIMDEVFDPDFFMHKEDIDVCWRAQLRGWSSVYVPDAVAHHVRSFRPGHQNRRIINREMRFYATRNRYLLMLKNEISSHFWRCLPSIVSYDLGILGYLLLKERETFPALTAALALSKRMLLKRRIIQTSRRVSWQDIQHWFE